MWLQIKVSRAPFNALALEFFIIIIIILPLAPYGIGVKARWLGHEANLSFKLTLE